MKKARFLHRICLILVILTVMTSELAFITKKASSTTLENNNRNRAANSMLENSMRYQNDSLASFGFIKERASIKNHDSKSGTSKISAIITGYTSDVIETDDTPFITASGSNVRDGIVAANFLPIGTEIKIPDMFGDKVFVVEDRMNARFKKESNNYIDIWFSEKKKAIEFGKKIFEVEIL